MKRYFKENNIEIKPVEIIKTDAEKLLDLKEVLNNHRAKAYNRKACYGRKGLGQP